MEIHLTESDKKEIESLNNIAKRFKIIMFSGGFALIGGLAMICVGWYYSVDLALTRGVFLVFVGLAIVFVNIKYRKIQCIVNKLLHMTQQ